MFKLTGYNVDLVNVKMLMFVFGKEENNTIEKSSL